MTMIKKLALVSFTLFLATYVAAVEATSPATDEQPMPGNRMDSSKGFYFSLGNMSLDSENAANEFIGNDAINLTVGFAGHKDQFTYAAGLNLLFLSDNDSFSQYVESNWGGSSVESSSALGIGAFGEMGYSHVFESGDVSFDILGGIEFMSAERSIANCSNCYSESIDLDSGVYFKPKFNFYTSKRLVFSVAYQHYLSGDIEGGLSLGLGWQF